MPDLSDHVGRNAQSTTALSLPGALMPPGEAGEVVTVEPTVASSRSWQVVTASAATTMPSIERGRISRTIRLVMLDPSHGLTMRATQVDRKTEDSSAPKLRACQG
jgi:hypothetical protein